MFELGRGYFDNGHYPMAVSLFERTVSLDDSFYSTQALLYIAEAFKRLGRPKQELETYRRIAELPKDRRGLVPAEGMGVALSRTGNLAAAREFYLEYLSKFGDIVSIEANLSELLLVTKEYKECIEYSSRVAARPTPQHQIIGRLLKGAALYFSGDRTGAVAEFRWIGDYLISINSVPGDFSWDFEDSRAVLEKLTVPEGALVFQLLDKKLEFQEFANKWAALNAPPKQV